MSCPNCFGSGCESCLWSGTDPDDFDDFDDFDDCEEWEGDYY